MNVLIVHSHPEVNSFCSALKNLAADHLRYMGQKVEVSDLYLMSFNPVGYKYDFKELSNRDYFKYQMEQLHASKNNLFDDELRVEMIKLNQANLIIFNFPLWWFSMPAMLKGWVDRVFAMGVVYGGGKGIYHDGIFKEKKAFCCITTGGPEAAYQEDGFNGDIMKILYPINHGIFFFTGMQTLPSFIAYSPAHKKDEERFQILDNYREYLNNLDKMAPLFY